MGLETLAYSPFNHLTWLVAREGFIESRSLKILINSRCAIYRLAYLVVCWAYLRISFSYSLFKTCFTYWNLCRSILYILYILHILYILICYRVFIFYNWRELSAICPQVSAVVPVAVSIRSCT